MSWPPSAVQDRLSHQPYPRRKREEVTNRVKHSNNVPWVATTPIRAVRRRWSCQHQGGLGLGSDGTVNPGELSYERRYGEQAKGADRLEPTGNAAGTGGTECITASARPEAPLDACPS